MRELVKDVTGGARYGPAASGAMLLLLALGPRPAAANEAGEPTTVASAAPADGDRLTLAVALPATLTVVGTAGAALAAAGLWLWSDDPDQWDAWTGIAAGFGALAVVSPELGYWTLGEGRRGAGHVVLRLGTMAGASLAGFLVGVAIAPYSRCSSGTPDLSGFCELGNMGALAVQMTTLGAFLAAGNLGYAIWEWIDTGRADAGSGGAADGEGTRVAWSLSPFVARGPDGGPLVGATVGLRL
ncbi:MAG: hypothetical protein HY905_16540 [Deltaproteobacteria bacterium]|nr:hypothetical protein [Deltaproteobacteria bacterium]